MYEEHTENNYSTTASIITVNERVIAYRSGGYHCQERNGLTNHECIRARSPIT